MDPLRLQRLDESAIPELLSLASRVGWEYSADDLRTMFASGTFFGHTTTNQRAVSSAAIFPYDGKLASIGMVIVSAPYRGQGLGKAVTRQCIESLPGNVPIMLIATEAGIPLYERLGFQTVETIEKLLCDRYQPPVEWDGAMRNGCIPQHLAAGYRLAPLASDDVESVIVLDEAAIGARRSALLRARIAQADRCAVIRQTSGAVVGFALAVQRGSTLVIGPIVAPAAELALALLDYLAWDHHGTLRMDIPSGLTELMPGLAERGFRQIGQPPVMVRGAERLPSRNRTLFALAGMAFG